MKLRPMVMAILLGAGGAAAAPKETDEAALRRMTAELMDAVAPGAWGVWDRYLDDAMVYSCAYFAAPMRRCHRFGKGASTVTPTWLWAFERK